MLSPEDYLAEKTRTGKILVSVGVAFPQLANQPYLVVTAKMPLDEKRSRPDRHQAHSKEIVAEAGRGGSLFQKGQIAEQRHRRGREDRRRRQNALEPKDVGIYFGKDFDSKASDDQLWTNGFVAATKGK